MKITPLGERVLLKPVEVETKTKGGIVLPDTVSKEQPTLGEVIAIGESDKIKGLVVGSKVVYSKYAGTEIKNEGEKYIILEYKEVLAVVENN